MSTPTVDELLAGLPLDDASTLVGSPACTERKLGYTCQAMFSNTRDHFIQNVYPSYRAFLEKRDTGEIGVNDLVRLGTQAATALFHMREHLPNPVRNSELENVCPDYKLIGNVTNASKHNVIDKHDPKLSDASQIFEAGVITSYRDEQGEYRSALPEVFLRLDDGSERRLSEVLFNVMVMWCNKLRTLEVVDAQFPDLPEVDGHVSREEAARRGMPLRMIQGEEFKTQFRLRRFDYATNRSEPVDLTGATVQFRVYAAPKEVPLDIVMREGDAPTEFKVPLTEEQGLEFMRRKLYKRNAYIAEVLGSNPDLQRQMVEKYMAEHPDFVPGGSEPPSV